MRDCPSAMWPFDIFYDDDRIVDDQSDRKHDGQKRQQVQTKPEQLH
jgi:hypothetical protein